MKLSLAFTIASTMASVAVASKSVSGKNAAKILKAARRLDEDEDAEEEDELAYLANYNLKMIGCKAGEAVMNPESGEYEYNAAVFRLCPSESGCDNEATKGCDAGYGDFVVGLNTFVDGYFEDQRDNMQWDDNFEVDRYAECAEYEMEEAEDDGNQNEYANYQFYIGPTCTESGDDVRLAVFEDEACSYESETAFEAISNGWSLPYSSGGMVSTYCLDCWAYDEDEAAYGLREMCMELYQNAGASCETKMEYSSAYGKNEQGCEYLEELMPAPTSSGNGGKVFGWFVGIAIIVGLAGYIVWWRKRKSGASDGLIA